MSKLEHTLHTIHTIDHALKHTKTGEVVENTAKGVCALGTGAALATSGIPGAAAVGTALASVGASAIGTAAGAASALGATSVASGITAAGSMVIGAGAALGPLLPLAAAGYGIYRFVKWLDK